MVAAAKDIVGGAVGGAAWVCARVRAAVQDCKRDAKLSRPRLQGPATRAIGDCHFPIWLGKELVELKARRLALCTVERLAYAPRHTALRNKGGGRSPPRRKLIRRATSIDLLTRTFATSSKQRVDARSTGTAARGV